MQNVYSDDGNDADDDPLLNSERTVGVRGELLRWNERSADFEAIVGSLKQEALLFDQIGIPADSGLLTPKLSDLKV